MRNALLMAIEWNSMLPPAETPAHTCGYEGFYHLMHMEGDEELATLQYIIRDHDAQKFDARKATVQQITDYLNQKWGAGTFECVIRDSYRNMREIMEQHMDVVEKAKAAFEENGVTPIISPIRGGTDGARLSYMGLPCPNLSTGGYNFHGRKGNDYRRGDGSNGQCAGKHRPQRVNPQFSGDFFRKFAIRH